MLAVVHLPAPESPRASQAQRPENLQFSDGHGILGLLLIRHRPRDPKLNPHNRRSRFSLTTCGTGGGSCLLF
jgi:hypothetical protein